MPGVGEGRDGVTIVLNLSEWGRKPVALLSIITGLQHLKAWMEVWGGGRSFEGTV